jgi:hypothetical protein
MSKIVTVVKEVKVRYQVDTEPGKQMGDQEVIDIVKARMDAGSPLGELDSQEKVTSYEVEEAR